MKKLLIFIFILFISSSVFAGQITMAPTIIQSSDCTFLTWYGTLCHDTDDGRIYKWNGTALEEIQSGIALDTIWDAAGDLVQGTGADTAAKLSAGAAGTVLRAAGVGVAVGWSGYTIATPTTGGLLYGSSASAWANLAAGTEGQVLRAGASPYLPAWTTSTFADTYAIGTLLHAGSANVITGLAAGTNGQLLLGVTGAAPAWGTDLATATTIGGAYVYRAGGTDVPATDGGTGQSSWAIGDILIAPTTSTVGGLAGVATGSVLQSKGVSTAPAYSAWTIADPGASGGLLQSDGTNWARITSLTGVSIDLGDSVASGHAVTMDANGVLQTGFTALLPDADDGASLGNAASQRWSDLYLANGGTINWNNGDVILTHSTGGLAVTGQLSATTYASDGSVTDAELKFINTLSSNAQDQIGAKANTASPTFTGTATSPTVAVSGATGVSPFSTTGSQFRTVASTITDSSPPGTKAVGVANSIGLPTFASDGNSITVTDAVNLYIAGVPIDGGANMELTRTWGFYQAAGNQYLAGSLLIADAPAVPGARLQLPAGTTAALTAPLKLTSGTSMTTPEAGAFEFTTDTLSFTITTGPARKTIAFLESPSFTTPVLGVATATSLTIANVTNDNYLQITDNAGGRGPTGSAWELYPDAGIWKMNTNGTESTIAKLEAPTFVTSVGLPATLTSAAALTWTLMDNQASGLSFGATGAADILKIGTLDTGAIVTVTGNLAITGDGTFTGGDIILGANTTTAGSALFYGGTSGSITLSPVAVAGTTTLTIPAITGRVQIASAGSIITPSATAALTVGLSNCYTWTVTDDEDSTLTFSGAGSAGEEVTIIFTTAGTADEIITFHATLVSSTGTLTLGTTAGKFYTIRFISDGSHWYEVSRTAVQT